VLLKGVQIGTLYNILGSTISDGCNSSIVPEIGVEEEKTPIVSREKTMLWHQRLGILERRTFEYYMVKVWLKVCLTSLWILIYVNIAYMGSKIM
jgi:hypothetical protein